MCVLVSSDSSQITVSCSILLSLKIFPHKRNMITILSVSLIDSIQYITDKKMRKDMTVKFSYGILDEEFMKIRRNRYDILR